VPVATWAKDPFPVMQRFAADGSVAEVRVNPAAAVPS
jgi:hypothetical protein